MRYTYFIRFLISLVILVLVLHLNIYGKEKKKLLMVILLYCGPMYNVLTTNGCRIYVDNMTGGNLAF